MEKRHSAEIRDSALIELHDARLETIQLLPDGNGILKFKHLTVFRRVANEHFQIWSYRAEAFMKGVRMVAVEGNFSGQHRVSDGFLIDSQGKQVSLWAAAITFPASALCIEFDNTTKVKISLESIAISLLETRAHLEDWYGPLS